MKKILSLFFAGIMMVTIVGCSSNKPAEQQPSDIKDSLEVLTTVYSSYEENNKFQAIGGDYSNIVDNAPGKFEISDKDSLKSMLIVPEEAAGLIDDAASLLHAMNANTFTSGAFRVTESKNMETFTSAMKDAVMKNQWMCGFPELFIIVQLDDQYVVSAFGNTDMITYFKTQLLNAYPSAKTLTEETF